LEVGVDTLDPSDIVDELDRFEYSIGTDPDNYFVKVGGDVITEDIREPRVTAIVSSVARVPEVRQYMVELFRSIIRASDKAGIIVEGRDITTVVAPDAPVRILLTASEEARMGRRSAELAGIDASVTAKALTDRDAQDSRVVDFMNAADGVTTIDSTDLDFDQTVEAVVSLVTSVVE
ncbi:MAG: (d)CMP kinase, partial [Actinobacteria bacterium]|nr:(d)CMP kinase [Actinomycetota bacterium]